GLSDEVIRLRLFPISLRDQAKEWLNSLPHHSITTWEELNNKFLQRYFPPGKTHDLRTEINTFKQSPGESLKASWERFKKLLRRCPHHCISLPML
ncbi:UNVERIFIED_CONTAM: retrotransposon gag domain-containing protein, partial [Salmonella enterica subsp. enterica serovar Weltevreden]